MTFTNGGNSGDETTNPTAGTTVTKPGTWTSTGVTPIADEYSTEPSEYNTMKTQVLKYGGFYIGRFEAGVNSTTLRTAYSTAQTVVCKKGVAPYNYVPWGTSMSDASEVEGTSGAGYLAKSMYSSSSSVTSTLTYGCQWNAMCRYIGDSQRTNVREDIELTGNDSTDVSKNIYDLAGNCSEWTMEAYDTGKRVIRGSYYESLEPVEYRSYHNPNDTYGYGRSFRPTFYIK